MHTYYAVCNAGGPISVNLGEYANEKAAREVFEMGEHHKWIDEPKTDAEDDFEIDGSEMSEDEFAAELTKAGAKMVCDLDPIHNHQSGTTSHLLNGWMLWRTP